MAGISIEAGSALAQTIQNAAQAKLMDAGWAAEENDTTLSEYVTMMLVNGKDFQSVQSELGGELLGVGEDDPTVADFTRWLFEHANAVARPQQTQGEPDLGATTQEPSMQVDGQGQNMQDQAMADDAAPPGDDVPSGPKAMRNGDPASRGRGRGGRMLGQITRSMDRSSDDPLRRIKGAASGGVGRIDAHAARPPRGPRGGTLASGVQRTMNGRPGAAVAQMNPMMQQGAQMVGSDPNMQMQFMQMMEMQAQMMAQFMGNGQPPKPGGFQSGGRGGKPIADRLGGRRGGGSFQGRVKKEGDGEGNAMSLDKPLSDSKPAFDTMCKFNHMCTIDTCPFAHQSPANTRPHITLDMSDTCMYGAACTNNKCLARHPSPAQRQQHKKETLCKFFPNCSYGAACPFRHPDQPPCRNGGDCKVEGCPFAHSTIMCRYDPCTRGVCAYKHAEGQKRGKYEDKVWKANGGADGANHLAGGEPMDHAAAGKSDRFAELFKEGDGMDEELILPGQNGDAAATGGQNGGPAASSAPGGDAGQEGMPQVAS